MSKSWTSSGRDIYLGWHPDSGRKGLADAIRTAIRDGRLPAGTTLPSTRVLAADLGVARGTVSRVYAELAAEGYLDTRQGAPTTVAARARVAAPSPEPRTGVLWDLHPCRPGISNFPRRLWLSATRQVLNQAPAQVFDYAEEHGVAELRKALAGYLARARGVLADPERIVLCGGFSHGMALLAATLRARGVDEIAFEDPSSPLFRKIASAAGLRVAGVPVDDQGIVLSHLDSPAAVVTPAHQYPTGATLAAERRSALASWATRTGAVVIEDDYEGEFHFDGKQVGALQSLAPEHIVYAGTVSKTLGPGLRIAWLVLPDALVAPVREVLTHTGWRPPVLDQLVLAELIESGSYDRHIRHCRALYRNRRKRLLSLLPGQLTRPYPPGGLHFLLRLPAGGPTEEQVLATARRYSLDVGVLGDHWVIAGAHPVVGYATPAEHAFWPSVNTFLTVLRESGMALRTTMPHPRTASPADRTLAAPASSF